MDEILPILLPIITNLYYATYSTVKTLASIITPPLRSLFSSHPDLASLALLLIIFYVSLLILQAAGRWAYSLAASLVRLFIIAALVLGVVNIASRGWKRTLDDVLMLWRSCETVVAFVVDLAQRQGEKEGVVKGPRGGNVYAQQQQQQQRGRQAKATVRRYNY